MRTYIQSNGKNISYTSDLRKYAQTIEQLKNYKNAEIRECGNPDGRISRKHLLKAIHYDMLINHFKYKLKEEFEKNHPHARVEVMHVCHN